jgi:cephalosporin-C deacetylase
MRKIVCLLAFLLTIITGAKAATTETTLWQDTYTNGVELNGTTVASFKAGDVLRVYVTVPETGGNFKICYKGASNDWAETTIPSLETQWPWLNGGDTYKDITFTDADITALSGMNIYLYENGNAITKVSLVTTIEDNPVVWEGKKVFSSAWSEWQEVNASAFANAQEGYYLRIKFKDLQAGAQLSLSYAGTDNWHLLPGTTSAASISGVYLQYTITAEMLTILQEKGLIVSGINFTLTAIEILDPSTLKPLTLSVPVTSNWVFTSAPSFTIHVENPYDEAVIANAAISIATDKLAAVTTIYNNVEIAANGSEDIVLTMDAAPAAGFYHATATVNDDLARAFFFAVNPTSITSAPDKQSDFSTFWQTAKEQLAAIDINATLTEITSKSTAARKVYLVEMQSVPDGLTGDPVTIRGYYCEPTDGKPHPVIMHYLGYDSGYRPGGEGTTPYCPSGDANPNYAEFYLSTRGQSINNRPASDRDDGIESDFTNTYGDWFAFNFGDKDSYYYRGAYMDCVRALDFMATRETSDMQNLFAEGQSQGGAFTFAAASLSGRTFKAIAPGIPFMGDFPDYFELTNWPAYVARENKGTMTDAEMYAFLSYFDTKNLAATINCPVITSIGLQDNVCPPHTNIAPFNNLQTPAADKRIIFNPELGHQVNGEWYTTYNAFFASYAPAEENVETIWEGTETIDNTWTQYKALSYKDRAGLANARMTDVIRVTLTTTASDAHIQLSNPNKEWDKFSDEAAKDLTYSTEPQTFEYTIASGAVLDDIQITGIIVTGKSYTLTKVELVKSEGRYDAAGVTIGADGIATWSSSKKLDFAGTGVTPYYASAVETGTVTLTPTTNTWDYQGYVVKGAEGNYTIPVTDNADFPSTNFLKASADYSTEVAASTTEKYHYILAKNNTTGDIGFSKLTANHTLAAHKAYLETTYDIKPSSANAHVMLVFEDGETTGISSMHNSQCTMHNEVYDLQGRKVSNGKWSNGQMPKGLYIVNGRKVVIK